MTDYPTETASTLDEALLMIRKTRKIRATVRMTRAGDYSYAAVSKKEAAFLVNQFRRSVVVPDVQRVQWPEGPVLYIGTSFS